MRCPAPPPGANNTALGYGAGSNINNGSNNVFLGYKAGYAGPYLSGSGNIYLGYQAYETDGSLSNQLNIGNTLYGDLSTATLTTALGGWGRYENWVTYSEQFDNAAWTKSASTTTPATNNTAPDGQATAETITFAGAGTDEIYQSTGAAAASITYTGSVWMKTSSGTLAVNLGLRGTGGTPETTTRGVTLDTTWRRYSITKVFSGSATGNAEFFINDAGNASSVSLYAWGAQVEKQSAPGVYASTTTPAITATGRGLVVNGAMHSRRYALTDGATIAVDWNNGNVQSVTLAGNRTFTFANGQDGGKYILVIKQDATGSRTVTWPSSARWSGGTAPTLTTTANKTDYIGFIYNGVDSKYDGVAQKLNF